VLLINSADASHTSKFRAPTILHGVIDRTESKNAKVKGWPLVAYRSCRFLEEMISS